MTYATTGDDANVKLEGGFAINFCNPPDNLPSFAYGIDRREQPLHFFLKI